MHPFADVPLAIVEPKFQKTGLQFLQDIENFLLIPGFVSTATSLVSLKESWPKRSTVRLFLRRYRSREGMLL